MKTGFSLDILGHLRKLGEAHGINVSSIMKTPRCKVLASIQKQLQHFPAHIKHHQTSLHMDTCRDASRSFIPARGRATIGNSKTCSQCGRHDPIIRKLHYGPPQENARSPLISWSSSEVTCLKDLERRKWMEI